MIRSIHPALALFSLATALHAQVPRTPLPIEAQGEEARGIHVATDGDLSAILWSQDSQEIWVATSDGRATAFNPPVRIDGDVGGALKHTIEGQQGETHLAILGDTIYALWADSRSGGMRPYIGKSTDRGATWEPPVVVPSAWIAESFISSMAFSARRDATGDHLYVLQSESLVPSVSLSLATSHDGGASFSVAEVNNVEISVVSYTRLAVEAGVVHVAWGDRRFQPNDVDLFYDRSVDDGATFGVEQRLDYGGAGVGGLRGIDLVAEGSDVAIAFSEFEQLLDPLQVHVVHSSNSGASFDTTTTPGGYTHGVDVAHRPAVALAGGRILLAWADNRTGTSTPYFSASDDGGQTWTADVQLDTRTADEIGLASLGNDLTVCWSIGPFADEISAVASRDRGESFGGPMTIASMPRFMHGIRLAYNALYGNVVSAWQADELSDGGFADAFVGGYRPQTLELGAPLAAGATQIQFELSGFEPDTSGRIAIVAISLSEGSFPLPDLRNTGLTDDGLFYSSTAHPNMKPPLDADGAASASYRAQGLSSMKTGYAAAVSYEPATGCSMT